MPVTDSSLRLARDLKLRDRDELISLVTQRKVAGAHIRDFFDLADALLEEQSIADALARVPRTTLELLAQGEIVASRLANWLERHPDREARRPGLQAGEARRGQSLLPG